MWLLGVVWGLLLVLGCGGTYFLARGFKVCWGLHGFARRVDTGVMFCEMCADDRILGTSIGAVAAIALYDLNGEERVMVDGN